MTNEGWGEGKGKVGEERQGKWKEGEGNWGERRGRRRGKRSKVRRGE